MPAEVKVYTTTFCAYCVRAKMLLAKRGIAYEEISVASDTAKRDWLVKTTGWKTLPQIFIAGEMIGGSDELVALDRNGELVKRVFGSEAPA